MIMWKHTGSYAEDNDDDNNIVECGIKYYYYKYNYRVGHRHRNTRFSMLQSPTYRCWLLVLLILEGLPLLHMTHQHQHQHQQTGDFQDSFLDGVSMNYQEFPNVNGGIGDLADAAINQNSEGVLGFTPPTLSFGPRPLGIPHTEKVILTNKTNKTIHLTSISGSTLHFHSSFFEDKVIPSNGNTSFNVVFLGRELGHVDTNLFIHTSEGIHKYTMSGISVPSAYRLQPLVGVRLPHNASFSPLIYMHNPHDHPIQITEVYSSGGGVVLELPGGGIDGPQTMWRVPPHATRPIIAVKYHETPQQSLGSSASSRSNHPHIAYVRIKVNETQSVLVVAVEVFPSNEPGPYTASHIVDFGLGGTKDPPKKVHIYMGNSSPRAVRVSSVSVKSSGGAGGGTTLGGGVRASPTNRLTLPPFSPPNIHVATLTIDWNEAYKSGQCCGKVVIRTKQGQNKIVLPYVSQVIEGGLTFDDTTLRFLTIEPDITNSRQFLIKNEFKSTVCLTDIVITSDIRKHFEVTDFLPMSLEPNEAGIAFMIRLKSWTDSMKFESKITLNTNVSSLDLSVFIYNGELDLSMPILPHPSKPDTLDLGLVGASSTTHSTLLFQNPNPAPVCLKSCGADLPGGAIELLGCSFLPSGVTSLIMNNITACTCILPDWSALYKISVVAPGRETTIKGEVWVHTDHEKRTIPVSLSAANGGRMQLLDPNTPIECFPGTICSRAISIKSSFPVDMDVISVASVPSDPRLSFIPFFENAKILARSSNHLGWLTYQPNKKCEDYSCYSGFELNSTIGEQWLSRVPAIHADYLKADTLLLQSRYYMYTNFTTKSKSLNLTVKLDTNQVRNFMFFAKIDYIWPSLFKNMGFDFDSPLAQIGNFSEMIITFTNPSQNRPIMVQLLFDWIVGLNSSYSTRINSFQPACPPHKPCNLISEKIFFFQSCKSDNPDAAECGGCELDLMTGLPKHWLPGQPTPHPESCVFTLPPSGEKNVTIIFSANFAGKLSSLFYARNNLTGLEVVRLTGYGVLPSLRFGNRKPGSVQPLLFDLTDKHLRDCTKDKFQKANPNPNFTVKRTFVARNTGEIPIMIKNFYISDRECYGYGFIVLNCESFELLPNTSHRVDIAFTPDFTLTRIERVLIIETSLNIPVNYTLIASMPISLAVKCNSVMKRPPWEASLRFSLFIFLICAIVMILIAGFYDSDRILKMTFIALSKDRGVVHPPLDLRSIGQMAMSKKTESHDCCQNNTEKKCQKESPNWNYDERSFTPEELKPSPKYEESNQIFSKSKKKLSKRNSNPIDPVTNDLIGEQEIAQPKEKRNDKKNLFHGHDPWKLGNLMRNGVANMKLNKNHSHGNSSSDSSETSKLSSNTLELPEKGVKSPDITKKVLNEFNAAEESQSRALSTHNNSNKKHKPKCQSHSHVINSCEEDTSSTTTESSNNDDVEKDNDNSTSSSGKSTHITIINKKGNSANIVKKSKNSVQYRDSYEGDGEDEEFDHKSRTSHSPARISETNQRWAKNRENPPTKNNSETEKVKHYETSKINNSNNNVPEHTIIIKPSKKDNKSNAKKDKMPLSKKRSLDKSFVFNAKSDNISQTVLPSPGFNATRSSPCTPPAISTVWENKASFSDVVARSDNNSLYSNNFILPTKDPETIRKVDQKPLKNQAHTSSILPTPLTPVTNNVKVISDLRHMESHRKTPSDLGPIGSTHYMKKSPTFWTENYSERHFGSGNTLPNVETITKPQPQKSNISNINSNNSFFMDSNSYFSTNAFSDINSMRNTNVNAFGSSNPVNNNMNSQLMTNTQNDRVLSMNSMSLRDVHDSYLKNTSSGGIMDMNAGSPFSESNSTGRMSGLNDSTPGLDSYESAMQWDRSSNSSVNDKRFDMDYNNRNIYSDNVGWSGGSTLWDQSSMSHSGHNTMQDSHLNNIQMSPSVTSSLGSNDRGPAEWLWGYSNGTNNNTSSGNPGVIGSVPARPPPGLIPQQRSMLQGTPTQFMSQQQQPKQHQQQQPQQPQVMRAFDPFLSLSSIWSPGSALDRWANPNRDANKDQNSSSSRSNQYQ